MARRPDDADAPDEPDGPAGPEIPIGARIELPRRGTTFVRRASGPDGAPTVVLLHGWLATGALNWYRCFEPLSEHFDVLAVDHRGHGRGIRSNRRFRLADCADDVAAVLDHLGTGPVIAVGYSMGGPIAQLLWRAHPERVAGMVLIATGAEFVNGNRHRYAASTLLVAAAGTRVGAAAAWVPSRIGRALLGFDRPRERPNELAEWARREMARHSGRVMLEAAHAIANYSAKDWLGGVDVPTTVIVTESDSAVSPEAQFRMAMAIPDARIRRIAAGHTSLVLPEFGDLVTEVCLDVDRRARGKEAA